MIHFLNITVQCKGAGDFRAFLGWADDKTMIQYELRGYGDTPGKAVDEAWSRYNEDRDFYVTREEVWEEGVGINNPFQIKQIGNTVQVWYGPPGEPESEFIMQISPDWIPQIIETLQKIQGKQS